MSLWERSKAKVSEDLTVAAIPVFFATMGVEHLVLKRRIAAIESGRRQPDAPPGGDPIVPLGYERRDTMASLAMGVGSLVAGPISARLLRRTVKWLARHRLAELGRRKYALPAAVLLWDFLYYWDHRWSHEVHLFWASHENHHSSDRYNLSTALRQSWTGILTSWVYFPLTMLGFTPAQKEAARGINLLYQYWFHTEAITTLPRPAELVLNTASHHRVHHGMDPQYLDRNYGSILIVWDRLFGTFEPERRRVHYGLTKPVGTYNPLRIATHEFVRIGRNVVASRSWGDRLRSVFGRPGFSPAGSPTTA